MEEKNGQKCHFLKEILTYLAKLLEKKKKGLTFLRGEHDTTVLQK